MRRRALEVTALIGLSAGASPAFGDDPTPSPDRVAVQVGKTIEQNVGYTRGGWFCDDPALITADLITRNDTNYWVVTGVKAGSTQCRVGHDLNRPSRVFDVVVTAPPKPASKRKQAH